MRFLVLLAAAALASAQDLTPLVGAQNIGGWITNAQLSQVRVDRSGDTYFAGVLPPGYSVPATYRLGAGGDYDIIVVKMDAQLQQYRYITVIGGSGLDSLTGMQVDDAGHVFLSGTTHSADFPVTTRLPGTLANYGGFVLRLSTGGDKVDYSVLMQVTGGALLSPDGGLYIVGSAAAGAVPVTAGAYLSTPPNEANSGYVMRLRSADGQIDFATWLPGANITAVSLPPDGGVTVFTPEAVIGLSASGSQVGSAGLPLPTSVSLLDTDSSGNFTVFQQLPSARLIKYSPQGAVLQSTDVGAGFQARTIAVGNDGSVYLTGTADASFPTRNSLETCSANRTGAQSSTDTGAAIIALSPEFAITYRGFLSANFAATTLSSDGRYLYGPAHGFGAGSTLGGAVRLDLAQIPTMDRLSPACLANGASYNSGPVTPGEIMTIYGSNLGPAKGTSSAFGNGHLPVELAGVSVTVDGVPAPILYAQDAQINFIVPWATRTVATMQVCVSNAGNRACMATWASACDPAIFGDAAGPLIMLPDGTRTTRGPSGGFVTIYLTGAGGLDSPVEDGGISGFPLRRIITPVRAILTYAVPNCSPMGCSQLPDAEVSYAGNSPGSVWGLTQMNIKLPPGVSGSFNVTLSFQSSPGSAVFPLDVYPASQ